MSEMERGGQAETESQIRERLDSDDLSGAATAAIDSYGPEVLGWLVVITGNHATADDVFGMASEDLWRSLSSFRWECSLRTWFYTLARRAFIRHNKRADERPERRLELGSYDVMDRVRSRTAPWLRTEVKDAFTQLRDGLTESERELLVLRTDRDLSWDEIARILEEEGDAASRAARVRKRFQALKTKLRDLAVAKGLLGLRHDE